MIVLAWMLDAQNDTVTPVEVVGFEPFGSDRADLDYLNTFVDLVDDINKIIKEFSHEQKGSHSRT